MFGRPNKNFIKKWGENGVDVDTRLKIILIVTSETSWRNIMLIWKFTEFFWFLCFTIINLGTHVFLSHLQPGCHLANNAISKTRLLRLIIVRHKNQKCVVFLNKHRKLLRKERSDKVSVKSI